MSGPLPARRRFLLSLLVVALILWCLRALLPQALTTSTNRALGRLQGFRGQVGAIDVNLWRGAYAIRDLQITRTAGGWERQFLSVPRVRLELQWGALLSGELVAEVIVDQPTLQFELLEDEAGGPAEAEIPVAEVLDALLPFRLNRFVIRDGALRFRDANSDPMVDLYVSDIYLEALNISNIRQASSELLSAEVELAGRPFGAAELEARLRFDPLADPVAFELDASLRQVRMTDLNDVLRAYGSVDAEAGTLGVFAEFAASDGRIEGYVKTLIEDLALVSFAEIDGPVEALEAFWEGFVGLAAELLENQPRDRLAVIVPVSGPMESGADIDLVSAVVSLLRNAFVIALRPALDATLDIGDLQVGDREGDAALWVRRANLSEPPTGPRRQVDP